MDQYLVFDGGAMQIAPTFFPQQENPNRAQTPTALPHNSQQRYRFVTPKCRRDRYTSRNHRESHFPIRGDLP